MLIVTRARLGPAADGGFPSDAASDVAELVKLFEKRARELGKKLAPSLVEALRTGKVAVVMGDPIWGETKGEVHEKWEAHVKEMIRKSGAKELLKLKVPLRFDLDNPFAIVAAQESAKRVVQVTAETKAAIRGVIVRGFEEKIPVAKMARLIRPTIGLTDRDSQAVLNRAIAMMGDGVAQAQVDASADQYAARLLRRRSENIARTETITAQNSGQLASWKTARAEGYVDEKAKKKWMAGSGSDRTCPMCLAFNGLEAELDEPFVDPQYGERMSGPAHPGCRCTMGLVFPKN